MVIMEVYFDIEEESYPNTGNAVFYGEMID